MSSIEHIKPLPFDVAYSLASPLMTTDGVTAVITGRANYYGFILKGGSVEATAIIYDSVNTATGNIIDMVFARTNSIVQSRDIWVNAKAGISVSLTGTNMQGVIFHAPQG